MKTRIIQRSQYIFQPQWRFKWIPIWFPFLGGDIDTYQSFETLEQAREFLTEKPDNIQYPIIHKSL